MGQFDNDSKEEELRNTDFSHKQNKSPRKNNNTSFVSNMNGVNIGPNNGSKRISPRTITSTSPTKSFNHLNNNPKYVNVDKRNIYENRKNNDSLTLKVAIQLKNQEIPTYILENLLREGASTKSKIDQFNGSTLLHCASGFTNNFHLNLECLKILLDFANADDLSICDNHGLNIIHYAIINNKMDILKLISERLSKEKPKVSHKVVNEKAITVHNVTGYHHPNNTSGNFQKDYKAYNHFNRTPLHIAAQTHNEKAIRFLVTCHADGNVRDVNNQVALELALLSDAPQIIIDLLMNSTKVLKVMKKCLNNFSINDCRNVIYKLAKMGVNFNLRNRKNLTPIMISSQFGDTELLGELIKLTIDGKTEGLEAKDENLHTALHCACSWGHIDCVKILLENGADYEAKDNQSNTPLARASQWGRHEIVQMLLAKGANANAISGFNKAPIELAFAKGISNCNSPHWECIDLLIPHSDFSRLLFTKTSNVNDRVCFYAR
eukprot:TRINITY_DN523_c0_g1_i2.p1 TRINITY_DN523_c0_g1~~TRINITY_DN523_c0_g1_i2.p1  ORF type:complete len:492 (-),score=131.76 TRINITY_DN523_c0_g1_i2:132-1607(-)